MFALKLLSVAVLIFTFALSPIHVRVVLGSILSGLEATTLKPLVEQAMPTLIELMYDPCVVVRDTAAWTFGRICEIVPDAAINDTYLKPLLEAFVSGLKQEPRVAANVCWAFGGTHKVYW